MPNHHQNSSRFLLFHGPKWAQAPPIFGHVNGLFKYCGGARGGGGVVTFLMVGQGAKARKNVSVWLKRVALRCKNSQALSFPRENFSFSSIWTVYPRFTQLDNYPISENENSLSEKKLRLRFFLSQSNRFPAAQNYYSLVESLQLFSYMGVKRRF